MIDVAVYRRRVDWAAVIADLNAAGVSGYRLCVIMCLDWPTIRHWRDGGEPRHSYGTAILEVHTKFCGEECTAQRVREARLVW